MKIKYIPTGNIFDLPEKEAKRIYVESKGYNYEIIDDTDIVIEEEKEEKTTVFEEIVETDEETTEEKAKKKKKDKVKDKE